MQASLAVRDTAPAEQLEERLAAAIVQRLERALLELEPRPGSHVSVLEPAVSFRLEEPLVLEVAVGGEMLVPDGGRYGRTLPGLADGPVAIPIELRGPGALQGHYELAFVLDRGEPDLRLHDAERLAGGVRPPVRLAGSVADAGGCSVVVTAGGLRPPVARQGEAWSCALALPEGEHELEVRAVDAAGNATTLRRLVHVDATPPVVTLEPPDRPLRREPTATVRGRVSEPAAVLLFDGRERPLGEDGGFAVVVALEEGPNHLAFSARDPAGNESGDAFLRLELDSRAPELRLAHPAEGARLRQREVALEGWVSEPGCRLLLDGRELAVGGGDWKHAVPFGEGEVELELVAVDRAGNRSLPVLRSFHVAPPYPMRYPGLTFAGVNAQHAAEYTLDRDPSVVLIFVPGGEFLMGSERTADSCPGAVPPHRVSLSPYFISKYEITTGQYRRFCVATGTRRGEHAVGPTVEPARGMPWRDAAEYCRWAGLSLPTEAQWEFAARGTDGRRFPWGDYEPRSGTEPRCNFWGQVEGHRGPLPVGSFPDYPGPFGTLDQAGNVWEWCSDYYGAYPHGDERDPRGPVTGGHRVIRGGGFLGEETREVRATWRARLEPTLELEHVGFRPVLEYHPD